MLSRSPAKLFSRRQRWAGLELDAQLRRACWAMEAGRWQNTKAHCRLLQLGPLALHDPRHSTRPFISDIIGQYLAGPLSRRCSHGGPLLLLPDHILAQVCSLGSLGRIDVRGKMHVLTMIYSGKLVQIGTPGLSQCLGSYGEARSRLAMPSDEHD